MILYYITDSRQFPGTEQQKRERLLSKIAEVARAGVDFIQLREKDLRPRELVELAREALRIVRDERERTAGDNPHVRLANVDPHRNSEPRPDSSADSSRSKLETRNSKLNLQLPTRHSRLLVNSRVDVALAAGADGVHLASTEIPASDARAVWTAAATRNAKHETRSCLIAVSCHTPAEVRLAEAHGADFAVFAPVFEKVITDGSDGQRRTLTQRSGNEGLVQLRDACRAAGRPVGPEGIGSTHMPVLALGGVTLENAAACIEAGAAGIAAIRLFQQNDVAEVVSKLQVLFTRPAQD